MPLAANQLLKYNGSNWTNSKANVSELGDVTITAPSNNQVLTYNGSTWINANQSVLTFLGDWNATTNTPTIVSSVGTSGQYYRVTVSGNTNINGNTVWRFNDWIIFNGTSWDRISSSSDITNTFLPDVNFNGYRM